jgi:hypothetical protein
MHTHSERGVERNVELQGTRAGGDPTSSDHTFATIKNISQPVSGLLLSFAVFVWDEDGITAVDAALRDGRILVGT